MSPQSAPSKPVVSRVRDVIFSVRAFGCEVMRSCWSRCRRHSFSGPHVDGTKSHCSPCPLHTPSSAHAHMCPHILRWGILRLSCSRRAHEDPIAPERPNASPSTRWAFVEGHVVEPLTGSGKDRVPWTGRAVFYCDFRGECTLWLLLPALRWVPRVNHRRQPHGNSLVPSEGRNICLMQHCYESGPGNGGVAARRTHGAHCDGGIESL
jgi:hypothetical protein